MNDVNSNTSIIEKEDAKYLQGNSCDACDYLTAVACGAIGGLVDIFFVSTPEDSKLIMISVFLQMSIICSKFCLNHIT